MGPTIHEKFGSDLFASVSLTLKNTGSFTKIVM
jgi:hypothetical protein